MKNRAKCKLCHSIIESFHLHDHVSCKCGEISITGGTQEYTAMANDWSNFLRVDDQGNEIIITVKDEEKAEVKPLYIEKPTRKEKLKMLDEMIKSYENLPTNALNAPITGYDLVSALLLVKSLFED
jgi:aromatic ring hydroxylase|tara:strand:- start:2065 stop:2442 length:378 start_codon:yes stop_codon:yes gene_type:complete